MKLRLRLTLTVTAVMVPTAVALLWLDASARHDAAAQMLTRIVEHDLPGQEQSCAQAGVVHIGGPSGRWGRPPGGKRPPTRERPFADPPPDFGNDPPPPRPPAPGSSRSQPADGPLGPPPSGAPPDGPNGGHHPRPIVVYTYSFDLIPEQPNAPSLDKLAASSMQPGDLQVMPWNIGHDDVDVLARTTSSDACGFVLVRGAIGDWGAVLPATWLWLLPVLLTSAGVLLAMGFVVERLRRLASDVRRAAAAGYGDTIASDGDDEISELAAAFSDAGAEIKKRVAELERREQALRDFIANTTHDVMIPLTVLQGHLSEGETQIVAAREEAHYVAALVHNLGLTARLDSAQPQVHESRVDLAEMLKRVASRHRMVASERDIAIEVGAGMDPLYAIADSTLLEQAVSNLAYNAVCHNRDGGHVALIVESKRGASGEPRFRIRVLDDGPGIPASDIAHLMERGQRGDLARGRDQGQGIGLDIAKRAVEVQGFTLTLAPGAEGGLEADIEGPATG